MTPSDTSMATGGELPDPSAVSSTALAGESVGKIDIESLRARDHVEFRTPDDVIYTVCVGKNLHGILTSTNKVAQAFHIIICGGTNADSSEYTPNRVVVGGRLAYSFEKDAESVLTTPVIASMTYKPGPK